MRRSQDPYGDFVVRVMNSVRIARMQGDRMNEDEMAIIESVRECLVALDPHATEVAEAVIIHRSR